MMQQKSRIQSSSSLRPNRQPNAAAMSESAQSSVESIVGAVQNSMSGMEGMQLPSDESVANSTTWQSDAIEDEVTSWLDFDSMKNFE